MGEDEYDNKSNIKVVNLLKPILNNMNSGINLEGRPNTPQPGEDFFMIKWIRNWDFEIKKMKSIRAYVDLNGSVLNSLSRERNNSDFSIGFWRDVEQFIGVTFVSSSTLDERMDYIRRVGNLKREELQEQIRKLEAKRDNGLTKNIPLGSIWLERNLSGPLDEAKRSLYRAQR